VEQAPGRRTNVGRKAEASDQFRPPRSGLCVMKLCAPGPYKRFELLPNPARRRLAEYRRWTNGGRKVEPTDHFWPPRWRSIRHEESQSQLAPGTRRGPDGPRDRGPHRKIARQAAQPISEGGTATIGRWNGDGRKVEPTERFRPPHWRFIGHEEFRADAAAAAIRCDWGQTLAPSTSRHSCP